jgi:hypothetical protein
LDQTREGGADILGTPLVIEAKCGKKPPLWPAWDQVNKAKKDLAVAKHPVVIAKKDNHEPVVVIGYDLFLDMLADWEKRRAAWD